ncbi:hypothetical protein HQ325_04910 [Rhodococcus sp. BP-349]|uniref:hypothetical protein n=1 Tax=unclassified Rhodococcus (in: high G+C Gram-positive bacteria) TaxID=192944 RepID=UPI001C9B9CF1|nr:MULTISPECIES: hypothetical protein [unclassified Rhodococcus (in: high G+C Gram-positive bacteria)]MBY6538006.1 hypothetical protein [Rhodococcus sp. BP-363]MBY6542343.1 hypothetical protein [Rhodococcus sp. BP-369]MBY6561573.1 hypothetical protein [Rhodococcus sp. BP-370]MBY6575865.1 hypothetical protein [Rhodococcus sp. BP-364]MBY6585166.1 hypothetical protein [Rhodococcus sp. BP-358]
MTTVRAQASSGDRRRLLLDATSIGAATGLRSAWGILAATVIGVQGQRRSRALAVAGGAVVVEAVVDKLPATPARTAPGPAASRVLVAAATAALLGRTARGERVDALAVSLAAVAALTTTYGGREARRRYPSAMAAVVEDLAAATVTLSTLRRAHRL